MNTQAQPNPIMSSTNIMTSSGPDFYIKPLTVPRDHEVARFLFQAYASSLGFSLSFQGFERELAILPGSYQPPTGILLLAYSLFDHPLGCVAIRPLPLLKDSPSSQPSSPNLELPNVQRICECKRLYCVPESRGMGIGHALIERVIEEARKLGYEELWLDTLKSMDAANKLYKKFGFEEIERYNNSILEGQSYFGLKL